MYAGWMALALVFAPSRALASIMVNDATACLDSPTLEQALSARSLAPERVRVSVEPGADAEHRWVAVWVTDGARDWTRTFDVAASDCTLLPSVVAASVERGLAEVVVSALPDTNVSRAFLEYQRLHLRRTALEEPKRHTVVVPPWTVVDGTGSPLTGPDFAARVGDDQTLTRIHVEKKHRLALGVTATTAGAALYFLGLHGMAAAIPDDEYAPIPAAVPAWGAVSVLGIAPLVWGGWLLSNPRDRERVSRQYSQEEADRWIADYNKGFAQELGLTEQEAVRAELLTLRGAGLGEP